MVNYGIDQTAAPLSQQNFGAQREIKAPQFNGPAQTFVPGVGMLGPDLGGAVKGDLARQEYMLKESENQREEEKLGLAKEKFGVEKDYLAIAQEDLGIRLADLNMRKEEHSWKVEDRDKMGQLDLGMKEAMSKGGYGGVIDYLKTEDPTMALKFHAEKLKLDAEIMQNDVMQARAPTEKLKAMAESYAVLGKQGAAILSAKPEDREDMYRHMLPMIKKVNPDAPDTLERAVPMLMLSAAQATPESQLFASRFEMQKAESAIGKMYNDLFVARQQGDTEKTKTITEMIEKERNKADIVQVRETELSLRNVKDRFEASRKVTGDLQKVSKPFLDQMEIFVPVKNQLKLVEKDPTDGTALSQLRYRVVRLSEKGPLTADDLNRTSGLAGYANYSKNIESWFSGNNIALNPKEVGQVRSMLNVYMDQAVQAQEVREKMYGDLVSSQFSQLVDYNQVPKPSELFKKTIADKPQPTQEDVQAASQDPQARQEFIEYFGYEPGAK